MEESSARNVTTNEELLAWDSPLFPPSPGHSHLLRSGLLLGKKGHAFPSENEIRGFLMSWKWLKFLYKALGTSP